MSLEKNHPKRGPTNFLTTFIMENNYGKSSPTFCGCFCKLKNLANEISHPIHSRKFLQSGHPAVT
jgi:hypothetical protein